MFAGQSDVIIRSDVTSGVHPTECVFQFLGTVVACHEYTIVKKLCEKKSTIASWNLTSYPFACVGVKVRTFRMPWNGSFSDAPGISSYVSSTEVLGFSLMHSLNAILQKL